MAGRRKLIVVSNRAPVTFSRETDGSRSARRGGGGLVTALRSLITHNDVTWVASTMTPEDRVVAVEGGGEPMQEIAGDGSHYKLRFVAHDPQAYDLYYNVVSNPVLWFAQHYLWGLVESPNIDSGLHQAWAEGYLTVNRTFADAVAEELVREPDAAVFFHDYHLYIAPGLVRERFPDATLSHFVHIPWPQPDYWRVLPEGIRRALHEGLIANDLVSFQTERWGRNFLRSCEDVLGAKCDFSAGRVTYDGRTVGVHGRPISVDSAEFADLAESERVLSEEEKLAAMRPEKLIVRVDRTDPSKNIVRGFRAYELLLEDHPDLHGRVGMLALLDPSRQDIPEYSEYLGAIQRAARVVNDRFRTEGWLPLEVRIEDNFHQAVAAYKQFDVLLVNAIFDGMNLVAKEAPLVNTRAGVLVLSENTGVHDELGEWALTINPFDLSGQANALYDALTMGEEERRRRLEAIRSHVIEHDIAGWIESQLADLDTVERQSGTRLSV
jgi:trehalose 6-phosphate synthase